MNDVLKSLLPILVTCIAGLIAYWRYRVELKHQQKALLTTLFGELGSILEHYTYAAHELSNSSASELEKRLRWSKYGETHFSNDISRYGFLSSSDIRGLLQIGLRIRNNDHLCDMYLQELIKSKNIFTDSELNILRSRMIYIMASARDLSKSVTKKNPILRDTLNKILEDLPQVLEREL